MRNIDGLLVGSGNCRSQFLPMLYWKKELEMLSRLLKRFGMKDVKVVVKLIHVMVTWQKIKQYSLLIEQRDSNQWKKSNRVETGPGAKFSYTWWIKWRWITFDSCYIQHGYLCHSDDEAWDQWQIGKIILNFWVKKGIHWEVWAWTKFYEFTQFHSL